MEVSIMDSGASVTAPPTARLNALLRGDDLSEAGRILVVEDDDASRELIAEILTDEGCDVRTAKQGNAALEILQTWQPGLILLDLRMPGMSGYEFAERYHAL